jgi:hypothetical protein
MMHHHDGEPTTPLVSWVERLAAPLTDRLSRRRVKEWCRRQGFHLVRWRDAKLFEGPSTWTIHHDRYRIQVLDQDGSRRAGYLVFKRWWSRTQRAQVLWDEPSRALVNGSTPNRAQTPK